MKNFLILLLFMGKKETFENGQMIKTREKGMCVGEMRALVTGDTVNVCTA